MAFVRGIIGLLLAGLFVAFAIANRHDVALNWSPAHSPVDIPLYIIGLGALAIGFITGSIVTWFYSLRLRWEKTQQKRRITVLEKELGALRSTEEKLLQEDKAA